VQSGRRDSRDEDAINKARADANDARQQLRDLKQAAASLWRSLAPFVLPPEQQGRVQTGPDDLVRLGSGARQRLAAAQEASRRLRSLVGSYAGVLADAGEAVVELPEDVTDLEATLRIMRRIVEKLMEDVEGSRRTIVDQSEQIRTAQRGVVTGTAALANLGVRSPRTPPSGTPYTARPASPAARTPARSTQLARYGSRGRLARGEDR